MKIILISIVLRLVPIGDRWAIQLNWGEPTPGHGVVIEQSSDLIRWEPIHASLHTGGFSRTVTALEPSRFYRAKEFRIQ